MKLNIRRALLITLLPSVLFSQTSHRVVTERIDETRRHTLAGNKRAEANAQNDAGAVPDALAMEHMLLQLKPSPEREAAANQLIGQLHNPQAANFHHWLTAAEFGQNYGVAQEDVDAVTGWLNSHNLTVNAVYPNRMLVDFSGTAAQVRDAFQTEIHYLNVNGKRHIANISEPKIPVALVPAIAGVVAMHDFRPHAMKKERAKFTFSSASGATRQALTPNDLATIYNLNPLFATGATGQGQTIAVIEDTNLYSADDWNVFRTTFGLSQYTSGSLATVHPAPASGANNCADPGVLSGDDGEAILDAEWASASAPGASILVAACANTRTTFGGLIALQNLLNGANPPSIFSISYGECEAGNGAAANAAFRLAYQQAVAEGVSVFVSAGDEGAASCDAGATSATHGIGVSGYASTPYNVAVGGTDFADSHAGTNSLYWTAANNSTYGSAISYIPEIPWNDSCASSVISGFLGYDTPFGASGFCSSAKGKNYVSVVAGSGGPSGCASGSPNISGVVGGSCQAYAKPDWQAGPAGVPADGVRDLPDVSLFAGTGAWGHYYITCWSNVRAGGAACTGDPSTWGGAGGTSFSAPIMAGIQALVNQNAGGAQGNPNYVYYKLASSNSCDSASGGSCIFHTISVGDIAVNCGGSENCFGASAPAATGRRPRAATDGALSSASDSYVPAFSAAPGWNFATGLGSVDAYNLVMNWNSGGN